MRNITRLALAGMLLAATAPAAARAQTATPEGTTITNTATASWTDANNNSYTPVTAQVSVTVGFLVGVDVTSPSPVTPASPSTNNTIAFTIANVGNGTDSVGVGTTAGAGVTITGYRIGATSYATLALLNEALSQTAVTAGNSVVVTVVYTVAAGQGGATIPVTLTATSRRQSTGSTASTDASTTNVRPAVSAGVAVTPDGGTIDRLPSNGTQYTQDFTVQNNGNASDNFSVVAATNGTGTITIVSTSAASISLAAGASGTITVTYTVGNVAAGTTEPIRLTATSGNSGAISDQGDITIRVVRLALSMTKEAYRDNQTTLLLASDKVFPGEYIQYKITVTNNGLAEAGTVSVSDPLTAQLTYISASQSGTDWTLTPVSTGIKADLAAPLAAGDSRSFWVRARVK